MHHYHAFGLRIASPLDFPELIPGNSADPAARADVEINVAPLPPSLGDASSSSESLDIAGETALLRLGTIRYLVEAGRRITIDAPPGTSDADVRIWLFGTVMAALLHQRGLLPLHANLVELAGGGAAAFAGDSGAGKSTLAAWFEQRGRTVLGDDLCAVRFDGEDRPLVYRGIPRVKLWQEALDALGRSAAGLAPVASDIAKFHVPLAVPANPASLTALPLRRVYLLDEAQAEDEPLISPLAGMAAAAGILDNAFRWHLGQRLARGGSVRPVRRHCSGCRDLPGRAAARLRPVLRRGTAARGSSRSTVTNGCRRHGGYRSNGATRPTDRSTWRRGSVGGSRRAARGQPWRALKRRLVLLMT